MTKDDSTPAKIIGKVDLKKDETRNASSAGSTTGPNSAALPTATEHEDKDSQYSSTLLAGKQADATQNSEASGESPAHRPATQEEPGVSSPSSSPGSTPDTVDPEKKGQPHSSERLPATGYSLAPIGSVSGVESLDQYIYPASGVVGPPALLLSEDLLRDAIGGIWLGRVESALDATGRLVAAQKCENDPERIFASGRSTGLIFSRISKLLGGKIDSRRIGEATRAAGVDLELKQAGHLFELSYSQRVQIGRLPNKLDRMRLILEAQTENLSVETLKQRVSAWRSNEIPEDTRRSKTVLKQLQAARKLLADQETRYFVSDKDRLIRTLDQDTRSDMLKHAVAARKNVGALSELLVELEDALVEIEVAERKKKAEADESTDDAAPDAD